MLTIMNKPDSQTKFHNSQAHIKFIVPQLTSTSPNHLLEHKKVELDQQLRFS